MGDADDTSEGKTEVCINPDIYNCCKSCAWKRKTRHIPQEILFDIFLEVPAHVLHDVMRYVCREWNLMIHSQSFIHHHLRNATPGILIQRQHLDGDGIYVEMRRGCLQICKLDLGLRPLPVLKSCNGLVLVHIGMSRFSVSNPSTKKKAILPSYPRPTTCNVCCGLAFVEASMEYKVVHAYDNVRVPDWCRVLVLTIGVDRAWRHIDIQHLPLETSGVFCGGSYVTGGYVHLVGIDFVLTLNAETETIRHFPLPRLPEGGRKFLPMGSNLSFVHESSEFLRDVWEMNPETGEWTMLLSFDLEPLTNIFKDLPFVSESIIPFGWLAVREVLLLSTSNLQRHCIAYNLKTREVQPFELDTGPHRFIPHVNSLAWLEANYERDRERKGSVASKV